MPINTTLGETMADVAGQAMLADAIGQQASALAKARGSLDAMTSYASTLEGNVKILCDIVQRRGRHIDSLKKDFDEVSQERDALAEKNQILTRRNEELEDLLTQSNASGVKRTKMYILQVEYMRDLKLRLIQTEKALIHSSSRSEGAKAANAFLIEATKALANANGITEKAKEIMELAHDQFVESGELTPDDEMQKILEELKFKAPDFKPGVAN